MTLRIVRNVSLSRRNRPLTGRMSRAVIACTCAMLAACSNVVVSPSANYNSRVDYLVIHATSEDFAESLRLLTQPTANPVSSHYLVPAPFDPTYPRNDLRVYQLVPELDRAWHAGVSYWAGESALNDRSIGVEVVNEFKCTGTGNPIEETAPEDFKCEFPSYNDDQIALLIELLSEILDRFPSIDPIDVVGHSDIAILRKSDPGPGFPGSNSMKRASAPGTSQTPKPSMNSAFPASRRLCKPFRTPSIVSATRSNRLAIMTVQRSTPCAPCSCTFVRAISPERWMSNPWLSSGRCWKDTDRQSLMTCRPAAPEHERVCG